MSRYSYDSTTQQETLIAGNTYYNMISPIETSPTTSAHSKGDHFIYNGVNYEVIAENGINSGTTLVVGTNIEVADTIEEQIDSINETLANEVETRSTNGAHNLLPTYTTEYYNGITYTVDEDGVITVSGTPTAYSGAVWHDIPLPKGKYVLSGASNVVGMRWEGVILFTGNTRTGTQVHEFSINSNNDYTFDTSSYEYDYARVVLARIANNTEVSGKVYPMLRLASDPDTSYAPYAMTNRELTKGLPTEKLTFLNYFTTNTTNFNLNSNSSFLCKNGNIIMLKIRGYTTANASGSINIGHLSDFIPPYTLPIIAYSNDATQQCVMASVYYDGDIGIQNAEASKNYTFYVVYSI